MFENIKGKVSEINPGYIIIDTPYIDYKLLCSDMLCRSVDQFSENNTVPVWVEHNEKHMKLYGFVDKDERKMFLALIKLPGIGCNVALRILSHMRPCTIKLMQQTRNVRSFCQIKGIKETTARKIIEKLKI